MSESPRRAINLYSVRELSEPIPDVIRRVGEAGFEGVEFANRFREADPAAVNAALEESGVEPVSVHVRLPDVEAAVEGENDLIERCRAVGCDRIIVKYIPPHQFRTRRATRSLADRLAAIAADLDAHGVDLGYHTSRYDLYPLLPDAAEMLFDETPLPDGAANHAMEWLGRARRRDPKSIPSASALWNLFARTRPEDLFFELETAEVRAAGFDPAAALSTFSGRVPLVHLRDVAPLRFGAYEDVPNGEGAVDFEAVVDTASAAGVEWFVYENEMDQDPTAKIADATAFLDGLLGDGRRPRSESAVRADGC